MYTVCPKCTLALAVAASDLRAGQGYVRCGRCTNVFNALLNLRDETETSPGLPLDDATTASFMPEPTPLQGEDRRARTRAPAPVPQPELDLDLSPPAMPVPPADPEPVAAVAQAPFDDQDQIQELDLQVPEAGIEVGILDLTVPDPAMDGAELDLVVESASADEQDLDFVFDPSMEPEPFEQEIELRGPLVEAARAELPAMEPARPAPGPAPAPAPVAVPAPIALPAAVPAAVPMPMPAAAKAAPLPPPAERLRPREAPAPAAPAPRVMRATLPPQGLTRQGLTPLSAEPPRTPLPATGLTPLHATAARLAPVAGHEEEEFRGTGTYETIVLQGDSIMHTEELLPEQEFDDRIAAVAHQLSVDGAGLAGQGAYKGKYPAAESRPAQGPATGQARTQDKQSRGQAGSGQGDTRLEATSASGSWLLPDMQDDLSATDDSARAEALAAEIAAAVAGLGPTAPQSRPRWMLAAAVVLALLFGLQAVHHWRNRLATLPALNGPLTRAYGALGMALSPEWDLAAYDLRLLGASADPQDTRVIHVRMSLASHATIAQALPLVRLRLIDRYGKPLSAGDLQPAQYLPPDQPHRAFLLPDQRIDSDVRVLDPTQQASSFELDVCLPRPGGGLHCAGDLAFAGGHS